MFWKNKQKNRFDKLITWLIVWWAVASMFWLSKTKKWKDIKDNIKKEGEVVYVRSKNIFSVFITKTKSNISNLFTKTKSIFKKK